jgi:hypothetical protein
MIGITELREAEPQEYRMRTVKRSLAEPYGTEGGQAVRQSVATQCQNRGAVATGSWRNIQFAICVCRLRANEIPFWLNVAQT